MITAALCNTPALLGAIQRRNLDALVAITTANVTYTSGLDLYTQTLIPDRLVLTMTDAHGKTALVIWGGERDKVERDARVDQVAYYAEFGELPVAVLADLLTRHGLAAGQIGLELRYFPAEAYLLLQQLLPKAHFCDAEAAFAEARMIKTADEISLLRQTAIAMDRASELAAGLTRVGETERAFAGRITANLLTLVEAEVAGPDGIVAAGPNAAVMHHLSSQRPIGRGEIVRYGIKASFLGYWCIILRMAVMADISEQQKESYRHFADIYHGTLRLLRAGTRACDVFAGCRALVDRHGMTLISEKVGHSTGLVFRETPILQPSDTSELQPNMVLAYDYLVLDQRGMPHHIEDRVLVTEDDPILLSNIIDTDTLTILGR